MIFLQYAINDLKFTFIILFSFVFVLVAIILRVRCCPQVLILAVKLRLAKIHYLVHPSVDHLFKFIRNSIEIRKVSRHILSAKAEVHMELIDLVPCIQNAFRFMPQVSLRIMPQLVLKRAALAANILVYIYALIKETVLDKKCRESVQQI